MIVADGLEDELTFCGVLLGVNTDGFLLEFVETIILLPIFLTLLGLSKTVRLSRFVDLPVERTNFC